MAKKKQGIEESNILLESDKDNAILKEELEKYIDDKINKTFISEIEKVNKKLLREKRRKIITRNIIIIILLLVIGFLIYLLYTNRYFDQYFNKDNNDISVKEKQEEQSDNTKKETVLDKPKEPTLDELKNKYANLLDNYIIGEKSNYLSDYYNGNLSSDLKKYLTLNSIDFDTLKKDDGYQIIENDTFKLIYEKLFSDTYDKGNFSYDNNHIRYVSMMDAYITDALLKKNNNIKREIINIKVDGDKIVISTIEGLVKDNKLYRITDNSEISEYNDDLINYQDKLDKLTYTFQNKKLISLSK